MLDIMRKHASSWLIKVLFAAIIITFIFFFGYSSLSKSGRGGSGEAAADVNGRPIPMAEFRFFYDRVYEQMTESFKGSEVPEFARKLALSSTLSRLVSRELVLEQAAELGIFIPDDELATFIVNLQKVQQGGEFDPIFYKQQYLPYFKNRFGLNYEDFVRQDLEITAFDSLYDGIDSGPVFSKEMKGPRNTAWVFEQVTIEPTKLVESGAIKKLDEAEAIAKTLVTTNPKKWKKTLSALKVKPTRIGPLTIVDREKIFEGNGDVEEMQAVFTLTSEKSVIGKPVEKDGKYYVVRLISAKEIDDVNLKPYSARPFLQSWMAKLQGKAEVKTFINNE
jgi:SurA-like N-terminal domain